MKLVMFIFLVMFTVVSFGQEQNKATEEHSEFNICSFLTDIQLVYKYSNLELICYIRKKQPGEECLQYLQERSIIATDFATIEELHSLLGRYWSGELMESIPKESSISWSSFGNTITTRCGEQQTGELSVEEQEEMVLKAVNCISAEISVRKKEHNCSN